jgi:hypothetical protein
VSDLHPVFIITLRHTRLPVVRVTTFIWDRNYFINNNEFLKQIFVFFIEHLYFFIFFVVVVVVVVSFLSCTKKVYIFNIRGKKTKNLYRLYWSTYTHTEAHTQIQYFSFSILNQKEKII